MIFRFKSHLCMFGVLLLSLIITNLLCSSYVMFPLYDILIIIKVNQQWLFNLCNLAVSSLWPKTSQRHSIQYTLENMLIYLTMVTFMFNRFNYMLYYHIVYTHTHTHITTCCQYIGLLDFHPYNSDHLSTFQKYFRTAYASDNSSYIIDFLYIL